MSRNRKKTPSPAPRPAAARPPAAAQRVAFDRRQRLIDAAWVAGTGLFVYPIGLALLQDPIAALVAAALAAFVVEAVRAIRRQPPATPPTGLVAWAAQAALLLLAAFAFGELLRPWLVRAWGGNDLPLLWGGTAGGYLGAILAASLVWLMYRRFRVWPFVARRPVPR